MTFYCRYSCRYWDAPFEFTNVYLGIARLGENFFDFGRDQTPAWMVWGTFFRDEVPQTPEWPLEWGKWGPGGAGIAIAIWAMPKYWRVNLNDASLKLFTFLAKK